MLSDHYNNTVCQGHVKRVKETAQLRPPIQKPESNHCIPGWPYSHNLLTILHAFYFLRSPELLRDKCFRYPISIIKITLPWLKYFEKICNLKNQKTKRTLAIIPWAVLHSFPLSLFFFLLLFFSILLFPSCFLLSIFNLKKMQRIWKLNSWPIEQAITILGSLSQAVVISICLLCFCWNLCSGQKLLGRAILVVMLTQASYKSVDSGFRFK